MGNIKELIVLLLAQVVRVKVTVVLAVWGRGQPSAKEVQGLKPPVLNLRLMYYRLK